MNLMKFCFHWAMGCQTLGQISKKKWRTLIATWRVQIVMHYQLKTIKSVNQTGPKLTNNGGSIFLTLMARMVNRNAASPLLFLRVKAFNRTKKKKSSQPKSHSKQHRNLRYTKPCYARIRSCPKPNPRNNPCIIRNSPSTFFCLVSGDFVVEGSLWCRIVCIFGDGSCFGSRHQYMHPLVKTPRIFQNDFGLLFS